MDIALITPAKKKSREGNRVSACRWAKFLKLDNHNVQIDTVYNNSKTDLMIALHAWRSAESIFRYRKKYPLGPLIVAIGGTDANRFLKTERKTTLKAMEMADALVCLHDLIDELLPAHFARKLHVIRQSALPLPGARKQSTRYFDVSVVGHLRKEKDPLRAALAARLMPSESKLRVIHLGKAFSKEWANRSKKEMLLNSRYHWLGEVPRWRIRREYKKTHLMIISSIEEGGANIISESVVAGVPIIASNISGNIGLLGNSYPGYFPVGDERLLAKLLIRAEREPQFLTLLQKHNEKLRNTFSPKIEAKGWRNIVRKVTESR